MIRIAAVTLAGDSAITIARFRSSKGAGQGGSHKGGFQKGGLGRCSPVFKN